MNTHILSNGLKDTIRLFFMKKVTMTKFPTNCALTSFPSLCRNRVPIKMASATRPPLVSKHKVLMYSSLHEASFTTVMDDGYDASKYGYRIFVPILPTRTNLGSYKRIRQSPMSTHYKTNYESVNDNVDDYTQCMNSIDPSSLDILSSPEVLAILEAQRDWDATKWTDAPTNINSFEQSNDQIKKDETVDPSLSDCEEMVEGWISNRASLRVESFDTLPSYDEKKM
jgi:hypothetical protein